MSKNLSSIRDNNDKGSVGQFLRENIKSDSNLSIVSAYFTIYAYSHLKNELDSISKLKFLFGEPTFIKALDPTKVNKRDFKIEDDKLVIPIESQLIQKAITGWFSPILFLYHRQPESYQECAKSGLSFYFVHRLQKDIGCPPGNHL